MVSPATEAQIPIAAAAQDLLDTIISTFAEYEIEIPERRVVTVGSVSVDNPVLAVMYGGLRVGLPGNDISSPIGYDQPRTMTFNVELWREIPGSRSPRVPRASNVNAASKEAMDDSWILMEAAYRADQRNLGRGIVAAVTANDAQGGTHGVSLALDLQVP